MTDFSQRDPQSGVADILWQRYSPRAFDKKPIDASVVARLMDAARWSPSCFNEQPWQFYTSTDESFDDFLALLVEANQDWAKNASLLGFLVARRQFDRNGKPNDYARFDSGAAWMAMTLQARTEGLYTHGMGGIHHEAVAEYLGVDTELFDVVMGFAVGYATDPADFDDEMRTNEQPNSRRPLTDMWQSR